MRQGIYIGSFNPPHLGHLKVIEYVLKENYVDQILIIPTPNYWDKQALAPLEDRIKMLKFYETEKIIVDTRHNHHVYTIDLMKSLEKDYPHDKLYLILGADNIIHFDKWKNYQELLKYPIIVVNRNNLDITSYIQKFKENHFILLNNFPFIPISSTELRKRASSKYLKREVLSYIQEHHLYQEESEIQNEKKN